jgi:hypothetical protein
VRRSAPGPIAAEINGSRGTFQMMLAIFATMSLALLAGYRGLRWLAILSMLVCLALSIGLFLFEIYSPEYGFRMPWLQVQLNEVPQAWP